MMRSSGGKLGSKFCHQHVKAIDGISRQMNKPTKHRPFQRSRENFARKFTSSDVYKPIRVTHTSIYSSRYVEPSYMSKVGPFQLIGSFVSIMVSVKRCQREDGPNVFIDVGVFDIAQELSSSPFAGMPTRSTLKGHSSLFPPSQWLLSFVLVYHSLLLGHSSSL